MLVPTWEALAVLLAGGALHASLTRSTAYTVQARIADRVGAGCTLLAGLAPCKGEAMCADL
jgi:hypothetical protein